MNSQMKPMGLAMTPEQYAEEWDTSATNFDASSDYAWMAGCLPTRTLTVEIGCGNGLSTQALVGDSPSVVCIDNNQFMIDAASARLAKAGIPGSTVTTSDFPLNTGTGSNVQFLNANVMDAALDAAFAPGAVDAIAVWLMGSSPGVVATTLGKDIPSLQPGDMAQYRETVQERCIKLAEKWLRSGGVLHVTDRAAISSWNDKDHFREEFAKHFQTLAGSGFVTTKSNVMLRKVAHVGKSRIQHVAPQEAASAQQMVIMSATIRRK